MLLFVLVFSFLAIGSSFELLKTSTDKNIGRRRRADFHQPYDYYDEPDGFYVTLPSGEVRID
jgi:hypothetical protein